MNTYKKSKDKKWDKIENEMQKMFGFFIIIIRGKGSCMELLVSLILINKQWIIAASDRIDLQGKNKVDVFLLIAFFAK